MVRGNLDGVKFEEWFCELECLCGFPSHVLYYHVPNELENGGHFNSKAGDFNCAHLQLSSAFK